MAARLQLGKVVYDRNLPKKKVLTRIVKKWRVAAVLFGVVLTAVWVVVLAWLFLQLL